MAQRERGKRARTHTHTHTNTHARAHTHTRARTHTHKHTNNLESEFTATRLRQLNQTLGSVFGSLPCSERLFFGESAELHRAAIAVFVVSAEIPRDC